MLNDTMGTQPVKSWLENSTRHNQFCQQIKLEFFCFVFLAESSGWCEFGKVLNSDWNTALEETWVQLRQGEARQPILMLKKKVMAVSENPFWTRSVLEMATVSIPGWSQVPLRQCFSNLGGVRLSGELLPLQTHRPYHKPKDSECRGCCFVKSSPYDCDVLL